MWICRFRFVLFVLLGLWGGVVLGGRAPEAAAQIEELPRPDTAHAASFGVSVALGDSIAVVGASGEPSCGPNAGAVYVYERVPAPTFDRWRGTARLTPDTCRSNAFFGDRIALSGSRLLIGASSDRTAGHETDAVYVFERETETGWTQTARLTGDADRREGAFAADLDLDGDRAVVSTSGDPEAQIDGSVYVFDYESDSDTWSRAARLPAKRPDDAPGVLGGSVALHDNRIAVAASTYFQEEPGAVYIFRYAPDTNQWVAADRIDNLSSFFLDLALEGSVLLVGEDRAGVNNTGRATIYTEEQPDTWTPTTTLRPSLPYESGTFGEAVSTNGSQALVTGYAEQLNKDVNIDRVVYVFQRQSDDSWRQRTILDIGEVDFGAALDQHGGLALVSSVPSGEPGSAYIVQLP